MPRKRNKPDTELGNRLVQLRLDHNMSVAEHKSGVETRRRGRWREEASRGKERSEAERRRKGRFIVE